MTQKTSRSYAPALMLAFTMATGLGVIAAPAAAQTQEISTAGFLEIGQIERLGKQNGIEVIHEIKLKQRLAEIKGFDNQSRELKLVIDRRTGEVLERKLKVRYPH